jgi:hypothetical protein
LLDHLLLDISSGATERSNDVLNKVSSLLLIHNLSEQGSWLLEIVVWVLVRISACVSGHREGCELLCWVLHRAVVAAGLVVDCTALIAVDSHGAVSLIISNSSSVGAVDGDLVVVGTESVSVGVGVREDSTLEHLVIGELNTWDDMGWGEGNLLNLGEVILRVSVKIEFSNRDQRIVAVRDYLGHIEDVKLVVLTFLLRDELDIPCPGGEVTLLNVLEQILLREVLICG